LSTLEARPHVGRHTHSEAHFIFVLKGAYASSARGAGDVCGPATLIYNPPGTTHRDCFLSAEGRFLGLSIPAAELATLESDGKFNDDPHRIAHPRALTLAHAATSNINSDAHELEALALELLSTIASRRVTTGRRPPAWLKVAQEIITDGPGEMPSVAALARRVRIHPVHLARVFRAHLGVSPGEYARRRRVERATDRMLRTSEPLAEIAAALGYADQSHFTREFAREAGQSPARFRAALA
jgi:AraC family transcriptional regulator